MNLRGKRLLLLGGNLWKEAIRQYADSEGIVLIAVSNDPEADIFQIADEHYVISSTDSVKIKALVQEKKIDGIYMGGSEPVISSACQYINEMGLPCYCTKEQWDSLQHKESFKELCASCGLPTVPKYSIDEENFKASAAGIPFPVITKPTDGCGSSGFSVCHTIDELEAGYFRAKAASASGSVIIEKFVKNDGVVAFYTLSNAEARLVALEDKYPVRFEKQGSYVVGLFLLESCVRPEFLSRYDTQIKKLFQTLGMKEGTVWMEVFHDGDDFYFNEVGYRLCGTVSIYPVEYFSGINHVAADMYFALTGESKLYGFPSLIPSKTVRKTHCAMYCVHLNPGIIASIEGIDEIRNMENVIAVPVSKSIGSEVLATGTIGQAGAFVHFTYDTDEELREMLRHIQKTIKFKDVNGIEMSANKINPDTLVIRKA